MSGAVVGSFAGAFFCGCAGFVFGIITSKPRTSSLANAVVETFGSGIMLGLCCALGGALGGALVGAFWG